MRRIDSPEIIVIWSWTTTSNRSQDRCARSSRPTTSLEKAPRARRLAPRRHATPRGVGAGAFPLLGGGRRPRPSRYRRLPSQAAQRAGRRCRRRSSVRPRTTPARAVKNLRLCAETWRSQPALYLQDPNLYLILNARAVEAHERRFRVIFKSVHPAASTCVSGGKVSDASSNSGKLSALPRATFACSAVR